MLANIINWIVETVGALGYFGIIFMMFLESSFFPFPSEVVMIPAGYLASENKMNIFLAIISGVFGSLLGALLNYYLAKKLGRRVILAYGKYFFFTRQTLRKVDKFFAKHGHISTFTGRLIPVIRQYISLPAGLAKMSLPLFMFYTSFGAGIWVTMLAYLGFFVGQNEELIREYLHTIIAVTLVSITVIIMLYIAISKKSKKYAKNR